MPREFHHQMESIHQDYDTFMDDASDRQLISPSSPDINDIVGAPQLIPRIGHEYQVEVPSIMKESKRHQLQMNPADSELGHDNSHPFAIGLTIPTIWVHNQAEDSHLEGYLGDSDGKINVALPSEPADVKKSSISDNGTELRPTTFQSVTTADNKRGQLDKSKNYVMAPGTLSNSWSDSDVKSFVLGLFIFGKNFIQIKKFLENKGMGEILSFYYGKFYKSEEYRRWTSCKNMKGRKCKTGHKIFTGRRQHELLSRLLPRVSEEFQDTLLQISKSYMEGTTSLEEYISSLKSAVGLGVLVEAVGIGRGKEDLTSLSAEPGKNNREFSIPTSKAWSSLEPSDIIKLLTGGFRLSKAKSNDLFWEAVWPRLLARGWHSEQPNNQGYIGSKEFLVFLIPGVKKFSRRKLVKGDHYFDSVSDVLSKVVAEPNLLELEVEEAQVGSCNDEETEKGLNGDAQPDYHRHHYLKPRASTNNTNPMKFTVIDTSLVYRGKSSDLRELKSEHGNSVGKIKVSSDDITRNKGDGHIRKANPSNVGLDRKKLTMCTVVDTSFPREGNLSKVRELKCPLPLVELKDTPKMTGIARESDGSSSDDNSSSEKEATVLIYGKKNISNSDCQKGTHTRDATGPKEANGINPDDNAKEMDESCQNQKTCLPDGNQLNTTIKHQFCRRARSNLAAHPTKRRRLTACVKSETNRILENSGGLKSEKLGASQSSCFPDANKNDGDPVSHEQNVSSVSSSAEGSMEENNKGSVFNRFCLDKAISCDKVEKCESQPLTILDAPQVQPKPKDGEMTVMVEQDEQKPNDMIPSGQRRPSCYVEKPLTTSCDVPSMEQQPDIIPRRQSTRNRPLTVRALESLANEFLHVKRRQKRKGIQTPNDPSSTRGRDYIRNKTMLHHQSSGQGTTISTEETNLTGDFSVKESIASL